MGRRWLASEPHNGFEHVPFAEPEVDGGHRWLSLQARPRRAPVERNEARWQLMVDAGGEVGAVVHASV